MGKPKSYKWGYGESFSNKKISTRNSLFRIHYLLRAQHKISNKKIETMASKPIVATSLSRVLTRLFFFSLTYVELYRTSTCCGREFFRACFKTRNSFPAHHGGRRLWPLPSPMIKRTGAYHTPWATPPALGLGSIHRGGEW